MVGQALAVAAGVSQNKVSRWLREARLDRFSRFDRTSANQEGNTLPGCPLKRDHFSKLVVRRTRAGQCFREGYCVLYKRFHQARIELPVPDAAGGVSVRIDGQKLGASLAGKNKMRAIKPKCGLSVDERIAAAYCSWPMGESSSESAEMLDVDLATAQFDALDSGTYRQALVETIRSLDLYRELNHYLTTKIAKLELSHLRPRTHRSKSGDSGQLSVSILDELLGRQDLAGLDSKELAAELLNSTYSDLRQDAGEGDGDVHRRKRRPTGRQTMSEDLPQVRIELLPTEVERLRTDPFERNGEEGSTIIEGPTSALLEVTAARPNLRARSQEAGVAVQQDHTARGATPEFEPEAWNVVTAPPELHIEPGLADPACSPSSRVSSRGPSHRSFPKAWNAFRTPGTSSAVVCISCTAASAIFALNATM